MDWIRGRMSEQWDRTFDAERDLYGCLWRAENPRGMNAFGESRALGEVGEMYRLASQQAGEDWRFVAALLATAISETWGERYVPTRFMQGPAVPEDIVVFV